ncbi:MAG: class I SAM-dependent methyltransferase [Filimonas sp.]|nr:class I SAM-dependent methyltransferase [Filimonas sp.]
MDSTQRFSNRVENYVKYRPDYPIEIIAYLRDQYKLSSDKVIADIGSGTGISSTLFLNAGYEVYGVEPNKEMRDKSITLLTHFTGFHPVDGTAEEPNLKSKSIDAIIAGQAFHWFDRDKAKAAFKKILKSKGIVVLLWNERLTDSPFEKAYDELIMQHGIDYVKVDHRNIDTPAIEAFFAPQPFELTSFENRQVFDYEGLKGRLLSSSYMPAEGEKGSAEMIADLEDLFSQYKENNVIQINYETKMYVGKV